ncbi:hypothetical protein CCOS865_04715 [Pseudomonas reidholzensis]|uniref:Uncharacterized protein n=1 Tax=Pseudomonas reidholzensis TaxID=1785162 RepID=A0A383RZ92_9PSED|nr:hypothetical protein [Pseudomonas reidholzensis]SYX92430.1 hypothetical protein CCOS865_04715 [Pseudomonas reidholzensis]
MREHIGLGIVIAIVVLVMLAFGLVSPEASGESGAPKALPIGTSL